MTTATQLAQRILDEQGYVIGAWHVGANPLPQPGHVIDIPMRTPAGSVPGPFSCLGHATEQEYLRQMERFSPDRMDTARRCARTAIGFLKLVAE